MYNRVNGHLPAPGRARAASSGLVAGAFSRNIWKSEKSLMKANHVVVIGGGIGGMCAARVLSEHFERVTLIERDELPEGAAHRKGVPQSRHPHGLLDRGRRELSALFPGLDDSLHERGGLDMDAGLELATLTPEGWAKRRRTGHQMLFASRPLIESVIRDRVKKNPRV